MSWGYPHVCILFGQIDTPVGTEKTISRAPLVRDWKQTERRIAAILGGRRKPVSGRGLGDNPDIEHPSLSVKARASFPAWLEDALRQAELSATDGKTPAVVLHRDRRRYADALVVLRLSEFAELVVCAGGGMNPRNGEPRKQTDTPKC